MESSNDNIDPKLIKKAIADTKRRLIRSTDNPPTKDEEEFYKRKDRALSTFKDFLKEGRQRSHEEASKLLKGIAQRSAKKTGRDDLIMYKNYNPKNLAKALSFSMATLPVVAAKSIVRKMKGQSDIENVNPRDLIPTQAYTRFNDKTLEKKSKEYDRKEPIKVIELLNGKRLTADRHHLSRYVQARGDTTYPAYIFRLNNRKKTKK